MIYTVEEQQEIIELYELLMADPDPASQCEYCDLDDRVLYELIEG